MKRLRKAASTPGHGRRKVRDFVDYDYLAKLTPEEADYLERFSREFYNGEFGHQRNIHPQDRRRECYAANNARERDMWNKFDRTEDGIDTLPEATEEDDHE